jgi:alpha-aminoadipate carrier protein LysW
MADKATIYECATCGGNLNVPEDVMTGEILACPDCGVEFEVVSLDGGQVKLAAAENIKEDWGE